MQNCIGFKSQMSLLIDKFNSSTLHNSIIFNGPKGIGKRTFINDLIYNFFTIKDKNNLNHHLNLLNNLSHPNIKILSKEFDSKTKKLKSNISIEQVRNLKNFLNETSLSKNLFKIIIVDSADDFNINSSNSFLKTLEEPKSNTYLFLISHQISSLLPTIRSRCLNMRFIHHNLENFSKIITKNHTKIDIDHIDFLYNLTKGSPGQAILLLEEDVVELFNETLNILQNNSTFNQSTIDLANSLSNFNNEKFKSYLSILKSILILTSKIKFYNFKSSFLTKKNYEILNSIANKFSIKKINDKLDFLSNSEKELITFNLDKKMFMLQFLNI